MYVELAQSKLLHCNDITWASWHCKSSADGLFVQRLTQTRKYQWSTLMVICDEYLPVTCGFLSQRLSNAETTCTSWHLMPQPSPLNSGIDVIALWSIFISPVAFSWLTLPCGLDFGWNCSNFITYKLTNINNLSEITVTYSHILLDWSGKSYTIRCSDGTWILLRMKSILSWSGVTYCVSA